MNWETIYISNKKGENWYPKQTVSGQETSPAGLHHRQRPGPGGHRPAALEQPFEDKILNVYDPEQRKEVPKSVSVMVDAIGKPVSVAVLNVLENKASGPVRQLH